MFVTYLGHCQRWWMLGSGPTSIALGARVVVSQLVASAALDAGASGASPHDDERGARGHASGDLRPFEGVEAQSRFAVQADVFVL